MEEKTKGIRMAGGTGVRTSSYGPEHGRNICTSKESVMAGNTFPLILSLVFLHSFHLTVSTKAFR